MVSSFEGSVSYVPDVPKSIGFLPKCRTFGSGLPFGLPPPPPPLMGDGLLGVVFMGVCSRAW